MVEKTLKKSNDFFGNREVADRSENVFGIFGMKGLSEVASRLNGVKGWVNFRFLGVLWKENGSGME